MKANPVAFDAERYQGRLAWDFDVSSISPAIRGTYASVEWLVAHLVSGFSRRTILSWYPEFTEDDIIFALIYAHDAGIAESYIRPQPPSIDDLNSIIGHPMAGGQHKEQV